MVTLKKQAKIAGLLYLLLGLTGIIGIMYVPSQIMVQGDAAATANNILEQDLLYRFGIVSSLACQTLFIFLVLALYRLFKDVHRGYARLMVAFVIISIPISFLNEANHFATILLLKKPEIIGAFTEAQVHALAFFFIDLYYKGMSIVEIFWGLWLLPFGLLANRSGFIPKIFGILLVIACFGYLANSLVVMLVPDYREYIAPVTTVTGTVGEFAIIFWLLIKGVKNSHKDQEFDL